MANRSVTVRAAIIGGIFVIIASLLTGLPQTLYSYFSNPYTVPYRGKVVDCSDPNRPPIKNAKVTIAEDQDLPQYYETNSEGFFSCNLKKSAQYCTVRVEKPFYQTLEREVNFMRIGSDPLCLNPDIQKDSANLQDSLPSPIRTQTPNSTSKVVSPRNKNKPRIQSPKSEKSSEQQKRYNRAMRILDSEDTP